MKLIKVVPPAKLKIYFVPAKSTAFKNECDLNCLKSVFSV